MYIYIYIYIYIQFVCLPLFPVQKVALHPELDLGSPHRKLLGKEEVLIHKLFCFLSCFMISSWSLLQLGIIKIQLMACSVFTCI